MKRYQWSLWALSFAGLLFSGYLSAVKLISNSCAFNETCPYFLGYPACWYGFVMYLAMFAAATLAVFGAASAKAMLNWTLAVSGVGILFAGNFTVREIASSSFTGMLGLSTCTYGLIFYIAIFVVSLFAWRST